MFKHRPFALALAIFLLVFGLVAGLACVDLPTAVVNALLLLLLIVGVAILSVSAFRLLRGKVSKVQKTRLLLLILCVLLALTALLRASTSLLSYREARSYARKVADATFTIQDVESFSSGYVRYRVLLEEIVVDGETVDLNVTAALICDEAGVYQEGDRLTGEVLLLPVSEVYPDTAYALSDGIFLSLEVTGDDTVRVISSAANLGLFGQILRISQNIRARLSYALRASVGGDAGRLASAMLLGDRDALTADILRDFRLSGLSHLLAVSGLHLAVLVGMLSLLLRALGCAKRTVAILSIPLTLVLLLLTGCSLSACRASVMLICFALARCFLRKGDGLTMLFAAPAIILLCSPCAVFSVGLWMSFVSVLSLMVFMPMWEGILPRASGRGRLSWRALRAVLSSVGVSVIANLAVFPLLYLTGMDFSLAGAVTSLLTVPLTPFLLAFSAFALLLYKVAFFGTILARTAALTAEWLLFVARGAGQIRFVSVSTAYSVFALAVPILVLPTLILLAVLPISQGGRQKRRHGRYLSVAPILALLLSIAGVTAENAAFCRRDGVPIAYGAVTTGEVMVYRMADSSGVLFDLSDGRYGAYREGEQIGRELCISEWSAVVLTHYHTAQISSLLRFCRSHAVRTVCLPEAQNAAEEERLMTILSRLSALGTPYLQYRKGQDIPLGDGGQFFLSEAVYLDRSVQPIFFLSVKGGGGEVGYLSSAVYESGLMYTYKERISRCTDLIFGLDGPTPKLARTVEMQGFSAKSLLISGEENAKTLKVDAGDTNAFGEDVRVSSAENRRFYRRMWGKVWQKYRNG